jgi:hypothetical protein
VLAAVNAASITIAADLANYTACVMISTILRPVQDTINRKSFSERTTFPA